MWNFSVEDIPLTDMQKTGVFLSSSLFGIHFVCTWMPSKQIVFCSGSSSFKLQHWGGCKHTSSVLWAPQLPVVFPFVLPSWDTRTHPPAQQNIFLNLQTAIGAWITGRGGHVGRDGRRQGGGGTRDERQLITWHKPARSAADSSVSQMQGRVGVEGEEWEWAGWWGRRVSRWTYDSQRRAVWVCACVFLGVYSSGRWTHMWELELYNIITSCVAPEPEACQLQSGMTGRAY